MKNPIIQATREYDKFLSLNFNRDKNKKHIEEIKLMLNRENLLHLHPIIVNQKWEVIDGQHRLEAAKELGIEVYYIQENVSYEHILNSNLFQKKLNLNDVIKYYALKEEKFDYIKFRNYSMDLQINPKALLGLIFGTCSGPMINLIKIGKFRMPPDSEKTDKMIEKYKRLVEFSDSKKIKPKSMFTSHYFCVGFRNLIILSQFNENIFYSKLENRWFEIKPQINAISWTKLLIAIYNWKNQNQIEFDELSG